jgi:glycosyltransferase involved in cell wall biosynthesis
MNNRIGGMALAIENAQAACGPQPARPRPAVLIIIASLHHGGTEVQTLHTARALCDLGYDVRLLCPFEAEPSVSAWFESLGIPVDVMGLRNPRNYTVIVSRLARRIRAIRPDYVHVQYIAPGLLSVLAARAARVPRVVITVHQLGSQCSGFERLLFWSATRLADLTLCVSAAAAKSWFDPAASSCFFPRPGRYAVAHNCVDAATVAPSPARATGAPPVIGYVGRIRREKGVDILLQAAGMLSRSVAFRLVIVGDGPEAPECKGLAASLGIESLIDWRPFVSPGRLAEVYRSFDVLVVPSRLEGFGLVAAEAMAQGVPVVAANVGGLPEVVEDGVTGLLFAPGNPADLADKLSAVLSDLAWARSLGAAGAQSVRLRFSVRAYRARIAELYRSIAPPHPRRAAQIA